MGLYYRLIAIDVDGTLMTTTNELPDENRAALHRAHEAGVKVCLCTGRSLSETRPVIDQLGLDTDVGIFVFGAIVSELPSGETLCRSTIEHDLGRRVAAFFMDRGFPVLALYDSRQTGFDYRYVLADRATPAAAEALRQWQTKAPSSFEYVDNWQRHDFEPLRIGVVIDDQDSPNILTDLRRTFGTEITSNSIYAPNYDFHVVECFAPHVSKWHGIEQLIERLGITGDRVAAVGDDVNDVEMIRHAGLGIAMGNAVEPVKAVADLQVPTNNECGLARAIDIILDR